MERTLLMYPVGTITTLAPAAFAASVRAWGADRWAVNTVARRPIEVHV